MSNEQAVRQIVDGMPGLILTATAAGATEFVTQQLLEYFGKTLDEALNGWAIFDAVHPEEPPRAFGAWRRSLETGDPYDAEHRLCGANEIYRRFHLRGLAARDAEGRIIRWNLLLTDVEDCRQAEADLMEVRHE